jgi:hypothetical protein
MQDCVVEKGKSSLVSPNRRQHASSDASCQAQRAAPPLGQQRGQWADIIALTRCGAAARNQCEGRRRKPYRMRSIVIALEVDHAIYTTERGAATPAAMGIELLLGEDIPTGLRSKYYY